MLQLKNSSPFKAAIAVFPDEKGVDTLYVAVKATFDMATPARVAEFQQPVVLADEYWGEPGKSSLKYASEMHLTKPSTDIVLLGEACSPEGRAVPQLDVGLGVAGRRKTIRVFGDRQWTDGVVGIHMSSPIPFSRMPLVYERAYGGFYEPGSPGTEILFEGRNPVGKGFRGKRSRKEMDGMNLPNLEEPEELIDEPADHPAPACFGFVAPSWEPRKAYAGTYDESWQKKRAPYLPDDFGLRFFNAAHPDLTFDRYLKGGEPVAILNMSLRGAIKFALPECTFDTTVRIAGKQEPLVLNLETVLMEPTDVRFSILWRGSRSCDKQTLKVEQIDINLQSMKN